MKKILMIQLMILFSNSQILPSGESRKMSIISTDQQHMIRPNLYFKAVESGDITELQRAEHLAGWLMVCQIQEHATGDTLLHKAARKNNPSIVEFLLSHNPNLNIINDEGKTPLHEACQSRYLPGDIIDLLIKKGADQSIQDLHGQIALDYRPYYTYEN